MIVEQHPGVLVRAGPCGTLLSYDDYCVAAMACRWGTRASLYAIDATRHSNGVGQDFYESSYAIDALTA